jgi:hypothetical protein
MDKEKQVEQNFTINSPNSDTVTILQGKALPQREPEKVNIKGNIESVLEYLSKRVGQIEQEVCHILIDRHQMTITLIVSENSFYQGRITGALELHPDLQKWNINTGETWTPKQLSEFVKMNRSCFQSKDIAMKLSKELQDIKVKVEKEAEKSDNNRGDYKAMIAQKVIHSNIPESFKLNIPVFKGQPAKEFEVEIYISPDSFSCSFVSPEVNDIVHDVRDSIIDEQIKLIESIAPDIVIIEQ